MFVTEYIVCFYVFMFAYLLPIFHSYFVRKNGGLLPDDNLIKFKKKSKKKKKAAAFWLHPAVKNFDLFHNFNTYVQIFPLFLF